MADRSNLKLGLTSGLVGMAGALLMLSIGAAVQGAPGKGGNGNGGGSGGSETDPGGGGDDGTDGNGTSGTEPPPELVRLTGVVRDFRERSADDGHPDFELQPDLGFGHYHGNVAEQLGAGRKPVFTGQGKKVTEAWRDSDGRPICHLLYDAGLGDSEGTASSDSTGAITSADTFEQWFRDIPGVNLSRDLTLDFNRQSDGTYVFDDTLDPLYSSLGGFFPIEGELFGNPGGTPDRNFHFTFEMHSRFVYDASASQHFRFIGDDDVWVFVDGRLVIDLGGVHMAIEQYVELDRLGLVDGQTYDLDFFFAERHRTQSNFRIQTNLVLETASITTITGAFD